MLADILLLHQFTHNGLIHEFIKVEIIIHAGEYGLVDLFRSVVLVR